MNMLYFIPDDPMGQKHGTSCMGLKYRLAQSNVVSLGLWIPDQWLKWSIWHLH